MFHVLNLFAAFDTKSTCIDVLQDMSTFFWDGRGNPLRFWNSIISPGRYHDKVGGVFLALGGSW